jgi:CheY-like chemotaxis protein
MESIGTLAGGIAHDLNNVLAPILMSIELLRLELERQEKDEILDTIESSARRGAEMVGQVLSFARGVEGRRLSVQVKHLVRDVAKIASETFPRNIEIRAEVPSNLPPVLGDPTQIHQVLLNLSVNARDAMPRGGTLTFSAQNVVLDDQYAGLSPEAKPGRHVLIQVEDTGTGIPPEILEKVFDPFFTTKEPGKGTGLGLSTSLAIVRSHGGFIRAYSEPGTGSRFRVYLPATESTTEPAPVADVVLPRGNGEVVLVVDDEASVRHITRQTLEAFGYRVILAGDGAEALAVYASRRTEIALVLTDMMMPVMDGPATIRVLTKMDPSVRIIAASGLTANGSVTRVANSGVRHFLPKPYTAETLLRTVREVLDAPVVS